MIEKVRGLFNKYKDVVAYLFFGGCTTLVNVLSYWLCSHIFKLGTTPSTIIAWILAVLFAYVTNRKWVFHSENNSFGGIIKEILSFFSCRFATGVLDWVFMFVFVDLLSFNDIVIKIISNIVVIILNYVASKLLIFKKRDFKNEKK